MDLLLRRLVETELTWITSRSLSNSRDRLTVGPPNVVRAGANLRQSTQSTHLSKIDHFFVCGTVTEHVYHMIVNSVDWLGVFVAGLV